MKKKNLACVALDAFKDWLGRRLPDCRNVTATLSASLDRDLDLWDRIVNRLHLFTCDRCGRYLDQIWFMSRTLHDNGDSLADGGSAEAPRLGAELKKKLKDAVSASMMSAA